MRKKYRIAQGKLQSFLFLLFIYEVSQSVYCNGHSIMKKMVYRYNAFNKHVLLLFCPSKQKNERKKHVFCRKTTFVLF